MILLGIDLFAVGCAGRESQKNRFVRARGSPCDHTCAGKGTAKAFIFI